jgi:hypothetical protein
MTYDSGVKWEPVTLGILEAEEGVLVTDRLNSELQRLAKAVLDDKASSKARLNLSIEIVKTGSHGSVLYASEVKVTEPKRLRHVLTAMVNKAGVAEAQEHKQMTLAEVTPFTREEGGS